MGNLLAFQRNLGWWNITFWPDSIECSIWVRNFWEVSLVNFHRRLLSRWYFRPFGRGTLPYLGDLQSPWLLTTKPSTGIPGMILQVPVWGLVGVLSGCPFCLTEQWPNPCSALDQNLAYLLCFFWDEILPTDMGIISQAIIYMIRIPWIRMNQSL